MFIVILPVLPKSSSFPVRSSSSRTFFCIREHPDDLPASHGPVNTDQGRYGSDILALCDIGAFQQIDHGYPVFSRAVRFADILYVRVRGETPGCPVSDIEPEIDKILLFSP